MKKLSVILTLALCISNMHAQEAYLSIFGQEQAEWDYVYYRNRSEISATSASFGVYTADTIVLVTPSIAHERIRISGMPTGSIRIEIFNSLGHPGCILG